MLLAFSKETQRGHSQYELCFIMVAMAVGKASAMNNYHDPVAFVMDEGNAHAEHVRLAHRELRNVQKSTSEFALNMGSLAFEDDEVITALQAADMISWAERRKFSKHPIPGGDGAYSGTNRGFISSFFGAFECAVHACP